MSQIYFDNNATTKLDDEVFNAMLPYLKEQYGNPSSTYSFGKNVKEAVNKARKSVADLLNTEPDNIVFTSCGSESNVTSILTIIRQSDRKHIITTKVEHASIMETMNYLESKGYKITYLDVDKNGRIDTNQLRNAITDDTCLVTVMLANNEIGNSYPIK